MTLLTSYQTRVAAGEIRPDAAQQAALEHLDGLACRLAGYHPVPATGWRRWFRQQTAAPQGIYLWGPVGRGKSMLMDSFLAATPFEPRRRVHFHAFMLEVHDRIYHRRQQGGGDPVPAVADELAATARLLCFDEFQVTDVADAMILSRLFEALFARGVVMVATSNTPPDGLYENGLQRQLFLPFIALLKQKCQVVPVAGEHDYRRLRLKGSSTFFVPDDPAALARAFAQLTDGATGEAEELEIRGRRLVVPCAAHGVARFSFDELCGQPLGSIDYQALASRYPTFILGGVPAIPPEAGDLVRRFIVLIDILYDHRCKLIMGAAVAPEWIYAAGRYVHEFERTVSRLVEMQSAGYWDLPHQP